MIEKISNFILWNLSFLSFLTCLNLSERDIIYPLENKSSSKKFRTYIISNPTDLLYNNRDNFSGFFSIRGH